MSSAEATSCAAAIEAVCASAAGVLQAGQVDALSPRSIQQLVSAAVKLYMAKREAGCDFNPVGDDDLTATDVSATATGLLKAVRLEPFELTLWSRFGQL